MGNKRVFLNAEQIHDIWIKREKFIIKEWSLDIPKFGISAKEVRQQEEAKTVGKLKDIHIVFRNDEGILTTYSGKKALEILKQIDNEKTDSSV